MPTKASDPSQAEELQNYGVESYEELAVLHVKDFLITITNLLIHQQEKFDLLVGAGNSGAIMMGLTKIAYKLTGNPLPPVLLIPIKRYKEGDSGSVFDNSVFQKDVDQFFSNVSPISNVLYVDDETGEKTTLLACFKLIQQSLKNRGENDRLQATFVVEDRDAKKAVSIQGIEVKLISFPKKPTRHKWVIIKNHFEPPFIADIQSFLQTQSVNQAHAINIGLGMPIKVKHGPNLAPSFDYHILEAAKIALPQLDTIQKQLEDYLRDLVLQSDFP